MYTDLIVVLKIGKSITEISQEVDIRKGDNMASVLFLFLISAFAKSLDAIWEENRRRTQMTIKGRLQEQKRYYQNPQAKPIQIIEAEDY